MQAKYVHTNLIAVDWQRLAKFYTEVFGCRFDPPNGTIAGKNSTLVPDLKMPISPALTCIYRAGVITGPQLKSIATINMNLIPDIGQPSRFRTYRLRSGRCP